MAVEGNDNAIEHKTNEVIVLDEVNARKMTMNAIMKRS